MLIDLDAAIEGDLQKTKLPEPINSWLSECVRIIFLATRTVTVTTWSLSSLSSSFSTSATDTLPPSRLLQWTKGTPFEQVQKNTSDIGKQQFASITKEFSQDSKGLEGLAENLREVLFPKRDGDVAVHPPIPRLTNGDPYLTNKSPFSGRVSLLANYR
jgi:hypothetical protein